MLFQQAGGVYFAFFSSLWNCLPTQAAEGPEGSSIPALAPLQGAIFPDAEPEVSPSLDAPATIYHPSRGAVTKPLAAHNLPASRIPGPMTDGTPPPCWSGESHPVAAAATLALS